VNRFFLRIVESRRHAIVHGLFAAILCSWCSWCLDVHAQQQLTVVDSTYTATAQNTNGSSEYRMPALPGIPSNLKAPTDYSAGKVYVRYEVLQKPSDRKTVVNVCFQGNVLTCLPYPPAHTATGVYDFSNPPNSFWQFDMFDWTMGIKQVVVVLKDDTFNLVAGDPLFYPTKMRITISFVPPGKTYVPPVVDMDDAGAPTDASVAAKPDSGNARDAALDAGPNPGDAASRPVDAGVGSRPDAATSAEAGSAAGAVARDSDAGKRHISDYLESKTGCSTVRPGSSSALGSLWLTVACVVMLRGRRRPRR
jgi:hypothetical protein